MTFGYRSTCYLIIYVCEFWLFTTLQYIQHQSPLKIEHLNLQVNYVSVLVIFLFFIFPVLAFSLILSFFLPQVLLYSLTLTHYASRVNRYFGVTVDKANAYNLDVTCNVIQLAVSAS
jgi:hypothetical protein